MKNRLRVRRAELDVTQFQVARKAGFDAAKLSRIENDLIDPTEAEIKALARVLKSKREELFPVLAQPIEAQAS